MSRALAWWDSGTNLIGPLLRPLLLVGLVVLLPGAMILGIARSQALPSPGNVGLMALEHTLEHTLEHMPEHVAGTVGQAPLVTPPIPAIVAPTTSNVQVKPQPTFNGRTIRVAKEISMLVTAYSPDQRSCDKWADGMTASGYSVWTNAMKLVAADTTLLPFGSMVSVPGYHDGQVVPVLDRGGRIKGKRLDLLFPTHQIARKWGARRLPVTVWEYAD